MSIIGKCWETQKRGEFINLFNRAAKAAYEETWEWDSRCSALPPEEERGREKERESLRESKRVREGREGWSWGSRSEREDSSVMLLDVSCSPRTSLPASLWPNQRCRTPVAVLSPTLGGWAAAQAVQELWQAGSAPRAVWSQGSTKGRAGLAEEHRRKQTWVSPCWRSERCSAPWPWWPTGCLRLCRLWWDSTGPPSPEGGAQRGLSACVWHFHLLTLECARLHSAHAKSARTMQFVCFCNYRCGTS